MNAIGKIKRVKLREVWRHEAKDFTTWLQDNIEILNDILDVTLSSAEREQSAGAFSIDLVAEDDGGSLVVIENQLEKSNHDHLGKVITYLTSIGAKIAVWIVADARPEHINAINWLNESSSADFYLIKLEAIKIGESPSAPLFTLIVGPSIEAKQLGKTKKNLGERGKLRREFWTGLLEYSKTKTKLHSNISPNQYSWLGTSAGKRGLGLNYAIRQHDAQIEIYIDLGTNHEDENNTIFNKFFKNKKDIEDSFGDNLNWQPLENRRACRIQYIIPIGGWRDKDKWELIHSSMVDKMISFEKAFRPIIKKLK